MISFIQLSTVNALQPKTIRNTPSWNKLGLLFTAGRGTLAKRNLEALRGCQKEPVLGFGLCLGNWQMGEGREGGKPVLRKQGFGLDWMLSKVGESLWLGILIKLTYRESRLEQG